MGRGPGRPGGAPEVAAHMEVAKLFAERFEAGEDLDGYQHWQQPLRVLADGDVDVLVEEISAALRNQQS
jgi:signal recognition particle GTPase